MEAKDPEGYPVTFAHENPRNGTLIDFDPVNGTVTYKPKRDYVGDEEFTFTATDDKETESIPATVKIDVIAPNKFQ